MYRGISQIICHLFLLGMPTVVFAQDVAAQSPNYEEHIKPIFKQYCLKCHGDDKQEGDLNLQGYGAMLRGGSSGKVVEAGRSSQSVLFQAITEPDDDLRMPPNSPPIEKAKIELIRKWIDGGLLETSASKSMVKTRDLAFKPDANVSGKPAGEPAMPADLPAVQIPKLSRPFPVLAMDVSPFAPLVAVADQNQVRLLQSETEQELGRLEFPEGEPHVIRFSRNGAVLMVAGGRPVESGRVVLFDVASGKRLAEVGDEIDAVLAADLSPDQRFVALGGSGRVVKVYSTIDGELKYKLTKHTDWITAIAFSPDGQKLATADRAGGIHLWDANSGGILLNLGEHKDAVRALDWRGDSRLLASAGEDGRLIWWDTVDGFPAINKVNAHPPQRPPGTYGTIPNGVLAVRFDSEGRLVTSGRDQTVRVWDVDGNEIKKIKMETGIPLSNVITNQGKAVIIGDSAGNLLFNKL
ncbi:c-type cytochrome domain-containing protein [Rubinisphaera italica]|uniref:WD domain, G-beta repeat n=1 Tax=Rubinisphaera italica TaxID=2527969 RepID=A0A5C5XCT2_9PLAN|nr:c-type cytochrome domain-containing protein [Rubinisphaera italica]TWT60429.1 WD domain, G-beta repeat [Rubinisphaera italica]